MFRINVLNPNKHILDQIPKDALKLHDIIRKLMHVSYEFHVN